MANEKSKAEQYRDERKARIAKAAKKNAKGMEKRTAAKQTAGKVISIILAVVIALSAVGAFLNTFGVWDRAIIIGSVGKDKLKVTAAEYEYYYYTIYNSLVSQINQETSYYGSSQYNFDTSLAPDKQTTKYTDPETNEEKSWDEFLHDTAVNRLKAMKVCYNEAKKAGYKLDDADKAQIDEQIEQLRTQAKSMGDSENGRAYSLNAYVRFSMGPYNEHFLRKIMEQQTLVSKYQNDMLDKNAEGYAQADIDKEYNADKTAYDFVDFCMYRFSNQDVEEIENEKEDAKAKRQATADAETKKKANDFFAAVTDEASFYKKAAEVEKGNAEFNAELNTKQKMVLKSDVSSSLSEDAVKWLFGNGKAGEKKIFEDKDAGTYTIILLTKPMYQAKTVSVRHILFMTVDSSTGEALSEDKIAAAKKNAEDTLAKWQKGDKTEDSFAKLATELTEDTGSKSTGGLYENFRYGEMVPAFSAWSYDPARKTGDAAIVETQYGYHVMYFVGASDSNYYDATIRKTKASTDTNDQLDKMIKDVKVNFNLKSFGMKQARSKVIKKLTTLLQLKSQNASSQYSY
ncbi:MAG: peptidyl-prolyl cis-trans isomerase [Clostridia bacterium]|nr:peptidyl-prolyl cis-trans isomerase [Clostridia bacterium]